MALRKTGLNPLAYVGVEPLTLSADVIYPRAPTQNDINFNLSTRWLDSSTQGYYILVNLAGGVAQWILLTEGGQSGITSVTTDDSAEVVANASGNINIFGTHGINTTGTADPFPHTVTVAVDNTLTLGDISNVGAAPSLTLESGILDIVDGNAVVGNTATSALASEVIFEKSRSGGVITSGDDLGGVVFQGHDGTSYVSGASIISESSGTIATGRVAADLQFSTHPDSVSALTTRMTIASTGLVTINASDGGGISLTTNGGIVVTDGGIVVDDGGVSVIVGNVDVLDGNVVVAAGNVTLPDTTAAYAEGCIKFGGSPFVADYGTNNTFIGKSVGNATLTTASATSNTGIGTSIMSELTTGNQNTGMGVGALTAITTGAHNIGIGFNAGSSYASSESSNIVIGNNPGTTAESNVIRIGGGTGSGSSEQDKCFISGINGVTVGSPMFVTIDSATDQLGVTTSAGVLSSINTQAFDTTGTYTPTTGMQYCIIEVVGAGGGGGGTVAVSGTGQAAAAGGGGGGGYARGLFTAADIGASKAVTIGTGGTGGAAGGNNSGTTGGTTSVGALISATGGIGGVGSPLGPTIPAGGGGGTGSGGDFQTTGTPGINGFAYYPNGSTNFSQAGAGGSSFYGGGAMPPSPPLGSSQNGIDGTSYGGGGSGGAASGIPSTGGGAGGDGANGFVYITEYVA